MIRKVVTKKTHLLTNGDQNKVFGREACPIACNCGTQCGDNLAHRASKDNSGLPVDPNPH